MTELIGALGTIIALSVIAIVLTLNSFRLSAITGVVAILWVGLSLLALALCRYPFGIMSVIGVIGSIGVSIIITALQRNRLAARANRGAIRDIVMAQSRHIVSTTVTTFGGFWPPFAMAIAGGVLLSTVVSLNFVPRAFALLAQAAPAGVSARAGAKTAKPQAA